MTLHLYGKMKVNTTNRGDLRSEVLTALLMIPVFWCTTPCMGSYT